MHDAWAFARLFEIYYEKNEFKIRLYKESTSPLNLISYTNYNDRLPHVEKIEGGINLEINGQVKTIKEVLIPQKRHVGNLLCVAPYASDLSNEETSPLSIREKPLVSKQGKYITEQEVEKDFVPLFTYQNFHDRSGDNRIVTYDINCTMTSYIKYIIISIYPIMEKAVAEILNNTNKEERKKFLKQLYAHAAIQDAAFGMWDKPIEDRKEFIFNEVRGMNGGGRKTKTKTKTNASSTKTYLPDLHKCPDGRRRKAFRIKGKGNTLYVMYNGVVTPANKIN